MSQIPEAVSEKCRIKLEDPPPCDDTRKMRAFVLCHATWIGVREQGKSLSQAMKDAWVGARKVCSNG